MVSHSPAHVIQRHYDAHPWAEYIRPDLILGWDQDRANESKQTPDMGMTEDSRPSLPSDHSILRVMLRDLGTVGDHASKPLADVHQDPAKRKPSPWPALHARLGGSL